MDYSIALVHIVSAYVSYCASSIFQLNIVLAIHYCKKLIANNSSETSNALFAGFY
jgi:hypothetical protein